MDIGRQAGGSGHWRRRQSPPLPPPTTSPHIMYHLHPSNIISQPQTYHQFPIPMQYSSSPSPSYYSQPPLAYNNHNPNPNPNPLAYSWFTPHDLCSHFTNMNMNPSSVDNHNLDLNVVSTRTKAVNIPDSLVVYEILTKLPVQSIARFRCVCKLWNSLTREKQFLSQQMKLSEIRHCGVGAVRLMSSAPFGTALQYIFEGRCEKLMHIDEHVMTSKMMSNSCRGLVCIYSVLNIHLVNPSIRELVTLPPGSGNICNVALVYDASVLKYKVVRIFSRDITSPFSATECEVLTVGCSQTWRCIGDAPANIFSGITANVVGNQTIFWEAFTDSNDGHPGSSRSVSLDIQSETFNVIPLQFESVKQWQPVGPYFATLVSPKAIMGEDD